MASAATRKLLAEIQKKNAVDQAPCFSIAVEEEGIQAPPKDPALRGASGPRGGGHRCTPACDRVVYVKASRKEAERAVIERELRRSDRRLAELQARMAEGA